MAKQERSAGVVIFQPGKLPEDRKYLLLDYSHHWDFPKGHVEGDESLLRAALRELKEETGIENAKLIEGFHHEIEYFFRDRRKNLIHKSVWFCLAETDTVRIRLSREHVGYEFLSYPVALKRLTYAGAKEILRHAEKRLLASG